MRKASVVLSAGVLGLVVVLAGGCQPWDSQAGGEPVVAPPVAMAEPTLMQREQLAEAAGALESGEYESALVLFQEILAENPTITTAYLGMGEIHMIRKDYDRAEPAYARACRLEPESFDAQYGHGLALQMLERFVEAIRAYRRALSLDPASFKANLNLATTYLQTNDARRAVSYAERSVALDVSSGPARANLGAVYEKVGRTKEAIEQYLMAMELMEASPPLMMNLINALAKERRYPEMINAAENLIKIEPSSNVYERLGWAYFKLADYESSIEAYRSAVELDRRHWPSLNGIGVNALNTWLLSGKTDLEARREARDAFRRSLRINPDQPRLVKLLLQYNL